MNKTSGFSERLIDDLISVLSKRDGVQYTSYLLLNFSHPAVCLKSDDGDQKTVSLETAKAIMKEERVNE